MRLPKVFTGFCLTLLLFPPLTGVSSAASLSTIAPGQSWRWPLLGSPLVVRGFDPPPEPWLSGHRGVDLAGEVGALVLAAREGVVRYAGVVVSRPLVSIAHPTGLITTYEPVDPLVAVGEWVSSGQPIGTLATIDHTGCPAAAGSCLHWGLRQADRYLDPLALFGLARVRLLPSAARAVTRRAGRTRSRCCRSAH